MNPRLRQAQGLPWFRRHDGYWYVTLRGQRIKLTKGEENKEQAYAEWHRVSQLGNADIEKANNAVWVILEKFLDHKFRLKQRSYGTYKPYYADFKKFHPDLRVHQLTTKAVSQWIATHPRWGSSTQAYAVLVLEAALNWACKPEQGLIENNPIRGMKRPSFLSRGEEAILDPSDFELLCKHASPWVRDALLFLRHTGTRPGNLAKITASTIDFDRRCVRLEDHKTRNKTSKPLVIPLSECAMDILARLAKDHPEGPLFVTILGNPMIGKRLSESVDKLKRELKKKGLKFKGNPYAYGCRHTVATELLEAEVPEAKVASILGHKDTKMLFHHYAHLSRDSVSLASELDKAVKGVSSSASPKAANASGEESLDSSRSPSAQPLDDHPG